MRTLFHSIGVLGPVGSFDRPLAGEHLARDTFLRDAWLLVTDGRITAVGSMGDDLPSADRTEDLGGRMVLPAWVDAHTHLVFAAWRAEEFEMKLRGASYADIAAAGGGILNSARRLREAAEDELFADALDRLRRLMELGTGAIEIKSGYGLDLASELKMLRVIRRLKEAVDIPIKANLLAAHAVPPEFAGRRSAYVDLVVREIIPEVARQGLADFIDVFCEEGFFTVHDTDRILRAGVHHGLRPKIHANQLAISGGVQIGVQHQAISVDHLEAIGDAEIEALRQGATIPVALPGCSFYLGLDHTPVRRLIDAGLPVAIASDLNPGSAPSGNMNLIVSLACIALRMLPREAIHAATVNAAHAMDVADEAGSIHPGKRANLLIMRPGADPAFIPYSFGDPAIEAVYVNGEQLR